MGRAADHVLDADGVAAEQALGVVDLDPAGDGLAGVKLQRV
jgi:hypothetical protein